MEQKKKLIYEEGVFQVFTINGHPNGACYRLERKDKKCTCKGVIGEYYYLEDKYRKRIKELIKKQEDALEINHEEKREILNEK